MTMYSAHRVTTQAEEKKVIQSVSLYSSLSCLWESPDDLEKKNFSLTAGDKNAKLLGKTPVNFDDSSFLNCWRWLLTLISCLHFGNSSANTSREHLAYKTIFLPMEIFSWSIFSPKIPCIFWAMFDLRRMPLNVMTIAIFNTKWWQRQ